MKFEKYPIKRATLYSAGYDFCCPSEVTFKPGEWTEIDTGVSFDGGDCVKDGIGINHRLQWYMAVFPRSSLGMKYGMRFSNTVGIIDQDYRQNIKLHITVDKEYHAKEGERIAQGIIMPYMTLVDEIEPTQSRTGGMGSTGRM